ncbi:MAG: protein kinase [Candidatus Margulisiibacteriota bacterium]
MNNRIPPPSSGRRSGFWVHAPLTPYNSFVTRKPLAGRYLILEERNRSDMSQVYRAIDLKKLTSTDRSRFSEIGVELGALQPGDLQRILSQTPSIVKRCGVIVKFAEGDALPYMQTEAKFLHLTASEERIPRLIEHRLIESGRDNPLVTRKECLIAQDLGDLTLAAVLQGQMERKIPFYKMVEIAMETFYALSVVHRHGYVHRDVKPSNIMLIMGENQKINVRLLDFGGIIKIGEPILADVSTPSYASPEQFQTHLDQDRHYTSLTAASDYYSLAQVIAEGITGKPPMRVTVWNDKQYKNVVYNKKTWENQLTKPMPKLSIEEIESAYHTDRLPEIAKEIKTIQRQLNALLQGLAQKDPNKRPNFHDIIRKIEAILDIHRSIADYLGSLGSGDDQGLGQPFLPTENEDPTIVTPRPQAVIDERTVVSIPQRRNLS